MQDIRPRGQKNPSTRVEGFIPRTATPPPEVTPVPSSRPEPTVPTPYTPLSQAVPKKPALTTNRSRRKKWWYGIAGAIVVLFCAAAIASVWWYNAQLSPVDPHDTAKKTIKITTGMTPDQIGSYLVEQGVVRNELAFSIYTRLHDVRGGLQAGEYKIAPSEKMPDVVQHILSGKSDTFTVTFFPGATLYDPTNIAAEKRTDVYTVLKKVGYNDNEIRSALSKHYDGGLFAGKPTDATLEGYMYGETYQVTADTSVEELLQTVFKEYEKAIQTAGLTEAAQKRSMSLYQMITLASIVQREVKDPSEQRQVAQVFYSRLEKGISLGSDVTFIYAANQRNETPLPDLDSPYNTRIHTGLPPGPIATPGLSALQAVASPAPGNYLYFVAGDDGKTYFAHTLEEHERNVVQHCTTLCQ